MHGKLGTRKGACHEGYLNTFRMRFGKLQFRGTIRQQLVDSGHQREERTTFKPLPTNLRLPTKGFIQAATDDIRAMKSKLRERCNEGTHENSIVYGTYEKRIRTEHPA